MNDEISSLSLSTGHLPLSIQFYHLTTTKLEHSLPKLLAKALVGGYRTLVLAENESRVEQLNTLLWTDSPDSFLPHGSVKDGQTELQPILIATTITPLNNADLLVVTDDRNLLENALDQNVNYKKILDIFDGNDELKIIAARTRWAAYKKANYDISYFQQTPQGGWQKKL